MSIYRDLNWQKIRLMIGIGMNTNVAIWTRVSLNKKNEKSNVFIHKMNFVYKNEKKYLTFFIYRNKRFLVLSGIDDNFVP